VKPLQDKEETVYVAPGSDAETHVARRFSHKKTKQVGVAVTALCPGLSATSFLEVAGQRLSPVLRMMIMKPHPVAEAGVVAMLGRRAAVIPGFVNKATVFLNRLMPRSMQRMVVGRVVEG
jgi:short-subunit dehydrogenase